MAPGLRKARLWTPITALALVMLIWCSAAGASDGHVARPRQLRVGSAPVLPHGSRSLGALAQGTRISALIALKPRAGLGAYAREVTTPGSALFHHYLTVKGFRARFGDTAATISRVQRALRSVGLSPGRISGNGLLIPVTGSAAQLGRAFKTSFRRVQLDSGRVAYANTVAPDLPAAIAPAVMGVFGLSSVARPQATVLHARAGAVASRERAGRVEAHDSTGTGPQACSAAVGAADAYGGYTDTQVAATYGFDSLYAQGDLGAGQTIALYEAEPDLVSDIATFQSCYGTDTTVNYIPVDGGVGTGAGEGEAALDIEQIISLAPQATIDVYQDGGGTYGSWIQTYTEMADNPLVDAISTSWGIGCEVGFSNFEQDENIVFEQIAVEGKSAFAASGDNGSAGDCDGSLLDATDPASQPYVTATGGTSLFAPDPAYQTAWNESSDSEGGGGGGVSVMWPMPSYQSAAPASLGVISSYSARVASFVNDYPPADESSCVADAETGTYCREVPDVSANADPETGYAIYWTGGEPTYPAWGQIAGTSAAAPLWAAYTALANDSQTCNGAAIGFANPLLYEAAGNQGTYSADFTQITSGDNDYTGDSDFDGEYGGSGIPVSFTGGLYPATAGYNMATGLGTPVGGPLATTLCDENDTVTLSNPGNQSGKVGTAVNLVASATDNEQHALTFSATGLPLGLQIDPGTGTITGTPTAVGDYSVTLTASSPLTGAQNARTFGWAVSAPPPAAKTASIDNQKLTLTTPSTLACTATSGTASVTLASATAAHSGATKLKFSSVAFYIDKGVAHVVHETKLVQGKKRKVTVTTYLPNATSTHTPATVKLKLRGLKAGKHTLTVRVTYTRTVRQGKHSKTLTVTKTVSATLSVC